MLLREVVHYAAQAMVLDFSAAEIEVGPWQIPPTPWQFYKN
jgi:hypothetical protein